MEVSRLTLVGNMTLRTPSYPEKQDYSYLIWVDGATYYSKNGLTGDVSSAGALHTLFNAAKTAIGTNPGRIALKGNMTATASLDCTGVEGVPLTIDLTACKLTGAIDNKVIFDLTGSHDGVIIIGGWVYGDPTTTPSSAFLLARKSTNASAGQHTFFNTVIEGYYQKGSIYNYGSEENSFIGVLARNRRNASKVLYVNGDNDVAQTSDYQTIAMGGQSTTTNTFIGGHLINYGVDSQAVTIRPPDTTPISQFNFYGTMITGSASAIYVDLQNTGSVSNLTFNGVRITDITPVYGLYFGNAGGARTVSRITLDGCIINASVKEIYVDTSVTPSGWVINMNNWFPDNLGFTFTVAPINCKINCAPLLTDRNGVATILSGTSVTAVNTSGLIVNLSGSPTTVIVSPNTSGYAAIPFQATGYNSGSFSIITPNNVSSNVVVSYHATYQP